MKLMSENISTIAKALVAAQKVMGNATKDSKNPFFKSKYADLNAVREAVLPALNANGISVLQPTIYEDGKKFVQTVLLHESGEFISGLTEILSAKELDAQAQGSGISYARRYGLQSLANVGADDDDGNAASGKIVSQQASNIVVPATPKDSVTTKFGAKEVQPEAPKNETPGRRSFRKPTTGSEDL
jgi:hypothetical protein